MAIKRWLICDDKNAEAHASIWFALFFPYASEDLSVGGQRIIRERLHNNSMEELSRQLGHKSHGILNRRLWALIKLLPNKVGDPRELLKLVGRGDKRIRNIRAKLRVLRAEDFLDLPGYLPKEWRAFQRHQPTKNNPVAVEVNYTLQGTKEFLEYKALNLSEVAIQTDCPVPNPNIGKLVHLVLTDKQGTRIEVDGHFRNMNDRLGVLLDPAKVGPLYKALVSSLPVSVDTR